MVQATRALYIKLGSGGQWELECLTSKQELRLGFREVNHELYASGNWEAVQREYAEQGKTSSVASNYAGQIKHFYEADNQTLWITFHGGRLWWCFSSPTITVHADKSKTRPALGGWRSDDAKGQPLSLTGLSGKITCLQGFRGTICSVRNVDYLVNRINGLDSPEISRTRNALVELENCLVAVIQTLTWQDFETLIDLIFRGAGWQRISEAGGKQKTLDLDLIAPLTMEKIAVQVKSRANRAAFRDYQERFTDMQGYARCYFVVHSPASDLTADVETDDLKLWTASDIARLSVLYGLTEWVLDKAG